VKKQERIAVRGHALARFANDRRRSDPALPPNRDLICTVDVPLKLSTIQLQLEPTIKRFERT
jgi:hypothetical protein